MVGARCRRVLEGKEGDACASALRPRPRVQRYPAGRTSAARGCLDLRGSPMTVIQTTVTRPKPGRRHDAVAIAVEAAKLLERHGGENNRLLLAQPAGEATGGHVFISEFESGEAWGAFTDSLFQDQELETLL